MDHPENRENTSARQPAQNPQPPRRQHRPFPTVGDCFALLGIVLGVQVLVGGLLSLVAGFAGFDPRTADPQALGRYNCLLYLTAMSLGLAGVLLYCRRRGAAGHLVGWSTARLHPLLLLWSCVLLFAVSIVIEPLLRLLPDYTPAVGRGPWAFVMAVLLAPLFEELLCRGVVLGALRTRYGVVAAWLGSSLFFGVLHLVPVSVVNACIIGLILGYVYLATGSIWASVLLHAVNNAAAYALLTLAGEQRLLIDWIGSRTLYGVLYAAALAVAGVSVWKMAGTLRRMKAAGKTDSEKFSAES